MKKRSQAGEKQVGEKKMHRDSTARQFSYEETLAQQLSRDAGLMASIDKAMLDVEAHRVLSIQEFEEALRKRSRADESSGSTVAG